MPAISAKSRVQLVNLQGRPELNGKLGVALRYVKDKGRWQVSLDGEQIESSLALKEDNLALVAPHSEALAHAVVSAQERVGQAGAQLKVLHVITPNDLELSLNYGSLLAKGDDGLSVVIIGLDLPSTFPSGEVQNVPSVEPGIRLACFRGSYTAFRQSPSFIPADVALLSNPSSSAAGLESAFFTWAETLHALASNGDGLFICADAEPFVQGDWLGGGVHNERIIQACGFDILSQTDRNPYGCTVPGNRCNWYLWASVLVFCWPGGSSSPPLELEEFRWNGYFRSRCSRNTTPRFRFRPSCPELRPHDDLEILQAEQEEDRKVVEDSGMDQCTFQQREMNRQERGIYLVTEWLAETTRRAWMFGGHKNTIVADAAGAVAAAEEFADRSGRSNPPAKDKMYIIPVAASELAAKTAMSGLAACPGLVAVVASGVVLFESLVVEAMWRKAGEVGSEMVGNAVLGALASSGSELQDGMASVIGQRVADMYERLKGYPEPLLKSMEQELVAFLENMCGDVDIGQDAGERQAIAQAVVDNMDLAIAARGGCRSILDTVVKMDSMKPCLKQ